ncbi:IclR family transcriptional regulator [Streptomyces sp. NPDC053542]|uniref:IclR family transcriptional regulator n=1 Tax=Streptomyces sp. NPDC053542 TaxID=3365710 RepID=UPI0037D93453
MGTSEPRPADGSQTLERGLRALRLIAGAPHGMTATELAGELGVHRSVAYRLLTSLVRQHFAVRDDEARYRVGADLVGLAEQVRPRLREVAEQVLRRLADELEATACLVVRDDDAAVAVTVVEPATRGPRFSYRVGNRDPLDRGAAGIALLAGGPPADGEPARVTEARERGYALTAGEVVPGTFAVAAPIRTTHPDGPAGINLITHRQDIAEAAVAPVTAAAEEISARLLHH